MTTVFKPVYLDQELGELGRLPDGAIVNIGGTSSTTFTVGGRALLFDDGSSTGSGSGSGFTLQVAYNNSTSPAEIVTAASKNIVYRALNSRQFIFNANDGTVTVDGNLNIGGLLNGTPIAALIDHLNAALIPAKHTAEQISFDDTGLSNITGDNVQAAIESINSQLTSISTGNVIGFEYTQLVPSLVWVVSHNTGSLRPQVTVWDDTNSAILSDSISIVDANTIFITFASPQTGRAILMFF